MVKLNKRVRSTNKSSQIDLDDVANMLLSKIGGLKTEVQEKPYVIVEDDELQLKCERFEKENALLVREVKRLMSHTRSSKLEMEELEASLQREAKKYYEKGFSAHKVELKRVKNKYMKLKKEALQKDKKIEEVERSKNIQSWLLLLVLMGIVVYCYVQNFNL